MFLFSARRRQRIVAGLRRRTLTTGLRAQKESQKLRPRTRTSSGREAKGTASQKSLDGIEVGPSPALVLLVSGGTMMTPRSVPTVSGGSTAVMPRGTSTEMGSFVGATPTTIVATIGRLPRKRRTTPSGGSRRTTSIWPAGQRHLGRRQSCVRRSLRRNLRVLCLNPRVRRRMMAMGETSGERDAAGLGLAAGEDIAAATAAGEQTRSARVSLSLGWIKPWRSIHRWRAMDVAQGIVGPKLAALRKGRPNSLPPKLWRRKRRASTDSGKHKSAASVKPASSGRAPKAKAGAGAVKQVQPVQSAAPAPAQAADVDEQRQKFVSGLLATAIREGLRSGQ